MGKKLIFQDELEGSLYCAGVTPRDVGKVTINIVPTQWRYVSPSVFQEGYLEITEAKIFIWEEDGDSESA